MLEETKSHWTCVAESMKNQLPIVLQKPPSLSLLSYYKFAAKMIGPHKKVLDIGCGEGLGTLVLAKECGFAKGVNFDVNAIESATRNFAADDVQFATQDTQQGAWDAVVSFDMIECMPVGSAALFLNAIAASVAAKGLVVIGASNAFEGLEQEMRKFFNIVFMFSACEENIHVGPLSSASYYIAVGCKK